MHLTYLLLLIILSLRSNKEIYRHLSIDIINGDGGNKGVDVKGSVEKSLANFFQPETREIKCDRKCNGVVCNGVDASQTRRILSRYVCILLLLHLLKTTSSNLFCFVSFDRRSPKALLLHLKRFIVEEKISPQAPTYEVVYKKNEAPVEIPTNLSLDALGVDSYNKQDQKTTSASSPLVEYFLKSVVHHKGPNATSGHYTADAIRLSEMEQECEDTTTAKEMEERWFHFDDSKSAPTTLKEVTSTPSQCTAYMLLYTVNEDYKAIVSTKRARILADDGGDDGTAARDTKGDDSSNDNEKVALERALKESLRDKKDEQNVATYKKERERDEREAAEYRRNAN
jgi:hypothetical protein